MCFPIPEGCIRFLSQGSNLRPWQTHQGNGLLGGSQTLRGTRQEAMLHGVMGVSM